MFCPFKTVNFSFFHSEIFQWFRHSDIEPKTVEPFSMYSTLPRSLRETKLVTNVKVEEDQDTLKSRQDMVNTKSPAELSQICSLADIPVPSRLSRMVTRGQSASRSESRGPRAKSSDHVAISSNTTSMRQIIFTILVMQLRHFTLILETLQIFLLSAKLTSMRCFPLCQSLSPWSWLWQAKLARIKMR